MKRRAGVFRRLAALMLAAALLLPCCAGAQGVRYAADFEFLSLYAPATVAWLYHPNGSINAPVQYSADSTFYLRHRFNDHQDGTGSLFFTGETPPDFTEPVLVMHGNNTSDDSLFGSLYMYRKEGYYEANPTLYLYTPSGDYRLDVFAGIRTTHRDHESWPVEDSITLLTETLPEILSKSFLTPLEENLPEAGDQWLLLTTENRRDEGVRYVIYTRMRPLSYTGDEQVALLNQMDMDARETLNTSYTVEGLGTFLIYGQNDPVWDPLIFEAEHSSRKRHFGDGGCGPTAIAMAIANLVPAEDLLKINAYAPTNFGYTFCSCSLTEFYCYKYHVPYQLSTPEEMLRYFPLAVGSFATGHNTLDVKGRYDRYGSSLNYLEALCGQVFGLTVTGTTSMEEAFAFLKEGKGMAITCTVGPTSPFTGSSHYITLAAADEEYLYVLDPLRRTKEEYGDLDPTDMLEILTPGLVRMKQSDAMVTVMSPFYLISAPTETPEG